MSQTTFDEQALLRKTKLHREGIVFLNAVTSTITRKVFQNSGTEENFVLEEVSKPVPIKNHKQSVVALVPIVYNNTLVGNWSNGLTKEEKDFMIHRFGLPEYTEDTRILLQHGKEYNLAIPAECAEYLILFPQSEIAESKEKVNNEMFYFASFESQKKDESRALQMRKAAAALITKLTLDEKAGMLKALRLKLNLDIAFEAVTNDDIVSAFDSICFTAPEDVVAMSQSKELGMHLIINEMLRLHAIYMTTENGVPKFVYSKDGSLTTEIIGSSHGELHTWFKANKGRGDEFMKTIQDRVLAMRMALEEETLQPKIKEASFGLIEDFSQVSEGIENAGDELFKVPSTDIEDPEVDKTLVEFESVETATHEQLEAYVKRIKPTWVAIPKDTEKLRGLVSKWING